MLVADRERQISALLDVVEAMAGTAPTVVDLACGPGTISRRLYDRLPRARSIAVEVDPVLLTIASATFADDDRVQVVCPDLRDPGWGDALPDCQVDAVVTATALHWLPRTLFAACTAISQAWSVGMAWWRTVNGCRCRPPSPGPRRDAWWEQASREPALQPAMTQRRAVFETTYPTEEFSPPADWHIAAMRDAGFAEAGVVWRSGPAAVIAAVR